MKNIFIRKDTLSFKNYALIGSLLLVGFCTNPAKAMEESPEDRVIRTVGLSHKAAQEKQIVHNLNHGAYAPSPIMVDGHNIQADIMTHPVRTLHPLVSVCDLCAYRIKEGIKEIKEERRTKTLENTIINALMKVEDVKSEKRIKPLENVKKEEDKEKSALLLTIESQKKEIEALKDERNVLLTSKSTNNSKTFKAIMDVLNIDTTGLDDLDPAFGEHCFNLLLKEKFEK